MNTQFKLVREDEDSLGQISESVGPRAEPLSISRS